MLFFGAAWRSNNFIVGLTNVSPNISRPTLWNYTLCGQYPGAVPAGATVSLNCQDNLPPFRYVIVQFPRTDHMNFCELDVLVAGTRTLWIFISHFTCFKSLRIQYCWTLAEMLSRDYQRILSRSGTRKRHIDNGVTSE